MPSIPSLVCLKKENISPLFFSEWVETSGNTYISTRLEKYYNGNNKKSITAKWGLNQLEYRRFMCEITRDEYLAEYEDYIRNHRWEELDQLDGHVLGCWCLNYKDCHGQVLIKLFKERLLEKRMTQPLTFE